MTHPLFGIDPGHGPGDGNTAGHAPEHNYVWDMACRLRDLHDGPVWLSRDESTDPSLRDRARAAADAGVRLVVSLHTNAGPPTYHGAHAFYDPRHNIAQAASVATMEAWPKELRRHSLNGRVYGTTWVEGGIVAMTGQARRRWPRVASVGDTYQAAGVPWVLVELFYQTNDTEDGLGKQDSFKREMTLALARGLVVASRELP